MAKQAKPSTAKPSIPDIDHESEPEEEREPITSTIAGTTTSSQDKNGKTAKKSYEQMMIEAITENDTRRKGMSFALIKKFIKGKYQIEGDIAVYVKKAFEKLITKSTVERVSGKGGINGSIRLTKAYVEKEKKQQKLASKPAKPSKPEKKTNKKTVATKASPTKVQKDKNNNDDGKKKTEKAAKPKPSLKAKLNPKKTAITKTKIDRSGGKVRLSIVAAPDPGSSMKAKNTAKTNIHKKERTPKPRSIRAGKEKKQ
uniref:H15 domain-containing protein n=1 Tax=Anopheles christyi TaxID=43041 RepID=A0A182JX60_9DIPT